MTITGHAQLPSPIYLQEIFPILITAQLRDHHDYPDDKDEAEKRNVRGAGKMEGGNAEEEGPWLRREKLAVGAKEGQPRCCHPANQLHYPGIEDDQESWNQKARVSRGIKLYPFIGGQTHPFSGFHQFLGPAKCRHPQSRDWDELWKMGPGQRVRLARYTLILL